MSNGAEVPGWRVSLLSPVLWGGPKSICAEFEVEEAEVPELGMARAVEVVVLAGGPWGEGADSCWVPEFWRGCCPRWLFLRELLE